jgi:hypothetical protein
VESAKTVLALLLVVAVLGKMGWESVEKNPTFSGKEPSIGGRVYPTLRKCQIRKPMFLLTIN